MPLAVAPVVETVRIDPPETPGDKARLAVLREAVRRRGVIVESETVPVKPRLLTATVRTPEEPATTVRALGLAEIVKSPITTKVTETEMDNEPLLPVTVSV